MNFIYKFFMFVGGSIGAFLAIMAFIGIVLFVMKITPTPQAALVIAVEWMVIETQTGIEAARAAVASSG